MIKEKRNKGSLASLIIGCCFIVAAIAIAIVNFRSNSADSLAKANKYYDGNLTSVNSSKPVVIDIYGIYEEPIADIYGHNTVIWLVMYQNGYAGLEASENDSKIAELLQKGDDLYDDPERLVVNYYDASDSGEDGIENYTSEMSLIIDSSTEVGQYFSYDSYVSLSEAKSDKLTFYVIAAVLGGVGILLTVLGIVKRLNVGKAYNELYQEYPELNGSIDNLLSDADFSDQTLQIVIYKHHLITYYNGFAILDLNQTNRLYHHILTVKRFFITVNRFSHLIGLIEGSKKKHKLPINNIGNTTDEQVQDTFSYIAQHFPAIKLGK